MARVAPRGHHGDGGSGVGVLAQVQVMETGMKSACPEWHYLKVIFF